MKALIILFGLMISTTAYADQLVIQENWWRGGISYTLNTSDCLKTAKSISDTKKYAVPLGVISDSITKPIMFMCIRDGEVVDLGKIYQIPHDQNGKPCLYWSQWNGVNQRDNCSAVSNAVVIRNGTLHDYIGND